MPLSTPLILRHGDVCRPAEDGHPLIIAHGVNDADRMGAGVAKALYTRWPLVKQRYHAWARGTMPGGAPLALGGVQLVPVVLGLPPWWVANLCTQHGIRALGASGPAPLDYAALETCCEKLARVALQRGASVHLPQIGSLRGGGDWDGRIVPILERTLCAAGVATTVYVLAEPA